jgi:hypothetical protein
MIHLEHPVATSSWLYAKYLNLLQRLCKRELKKIADDYPATRDELIKWHDFMAIECVSSGAKSRGRLLGICVATSNELEGKAPPTEEPESCAKRK